MTDTVFDPRNYRPAELFARAHELDLSERHLRRLLGAVIGNGMHHKDAWSRAGIVPKAFIKDLEELPRLALKEIRYSESDRFEKLLFSTPDGFPVETVIIPLHKEGAATVCLSSQVGCVMGCAFCATARMSQRRNLATWEIVDQFIRARAHAARFGRRVTGAVFMGMGEPFLNYQRVMAAAELLCFPVANAIASKAITVSTVGLVNEIDRFTAENRPFRLSISIGGATDATRQRLVPVAARTPIKDVMAAARRHALARRDRVMLAYVCISGENVSPDDARAFAELVGDTPIRLDLIDVNDPTGRFKPPSRTEMKRFRDALRKYVRQPVARRYSGGGDISAACGTLAGEMRAYR